MDDEVARSTSPQLDSVLLGHPQITGIAGKIAHHTGHPVAKLTGSEIAPGGSVQAGGVQKIGSEAGSSTDPAF